MRSQSALLRPYHPALDVKIFDYLSGVDYGDAPVVPGFIEHSYEKIEAFLKPLHDAGVTPIAIGGAITIAGLALGIGYNAASNSNGRDRDDLLASIPGPSPKCGAGTPYAASCDEAQRLGDKADTQRIPAGGTPGYAVTDLRCGWRVKKGLSIVASVENVLDKDYRIHGSGSNEPGRNFVLSVDYRF